MAPTHPPTPNVHTSDTVGDVAGKKPMVRRTFFVPASLWEAAKAKAEAEENDISQVLRDLLERYVKSKRR